MEAGHRRIDQRRMRVSPHMRELASRVNLSHKDFIQPLFVDQHLSAPEPIESLRGMNADTIDSVLRQIGSDLDKGISKFLLFPVPVKKDKSIDFSFAVECIETIKWEFGNDIWLSADCCLCSYTTHAAGAGRGDHVDGIDRDPSVLTETAIRYAKAFSNKFAFKVNFSYMALELP